MSKFSLTNTITFDEFDGWKGCYVKLKDLTMQEIEVLGRVNKDDTAANYKKMIDLIQDNLVEGKGWNGKLIVNIKKEDLKELPYRVLLKIVNFFIPKAET